MLWRSRGSVFTQQSLIPDICLSGNLFPTFQLSFKESNKAVQNLPSSGIVNRGFSPRRGYTERSHCYKLSHDPANATKNFTIVRPSMLLLDRQAP